MTVLNCENVAFSYDGKTVVENLSFSVKQGEILCIVGENGSGKSTLVKGILGLKKPERGNISYVTGGILGHVGYLPQQTPVQKDFPATVKEVVLSGLLWEKTGRFFYTKAQKQKAHAMMETLEIDGLSHCSFRSLSGGQQQRVLLARALLSAKDLLVLDEPVTGLDPVVTADFYKLIHRLNKQKGMTVIMVSHDINAAIELGDKILHLSYDVGFFGPTHDYIHSEIGRKFLGRCPICG